MLPPQTAMPTRLPAKPLGIAPAAPRRPAAPAPSATVLAPSASRPIASSTARSGTTSTSATCARIDRERQLADVAHGDALGDGGAADRDRLAGEALRQRGVGLDLDADRPRCRASAPSRRPAQPAIRPPPPTGMTSASRSGASSQHLQRQRALAGDDRRDRRRGGRTPGRRSAARCVGVRGGLGQGLAVQHDLGAPGGGARHLGRAA